MKSAYERAMERLSPEDASPSLTEEQRAQIAELKSLYQSKIAERETFLNSKIAEAQAAGNFSEVEQFKIQLTRDTKDLREELEEKKSAIWKQ